MSSIGFWNCRGARKVKASLYAKDFIKEFGVFFLGLVETKLTVVDGKIVSSLVGEGWDFCQVPSEGLSGGILVIWKKDMATFNMLESSNQFLIGNLNVFNRGTWRIATIYGNKDIYKRRRLWERLEHHLTNDFPIILGGDFNCLLSKEEKKGGRDFVFGMGTKEMKSIIIYNNLHEVAEVGPKFTWSNNKKGAEKILEKLDKCLVNLAALNSSHRLMVRHLARMASDHCPILLNLLKFISPSRKVLKFEEVWTSLPSSVGVVKNSWKKKTLVDPPHVSNQKLKRMLKNLHYWSKNKFKALNLAKEDLKAEVLKLQESESERGNNKEEVHWLLKAKMEELNSVMSRLDSWWKQRAKVKWLVDGDTNSMFFQSYASGRMNTNFIHKIKDEQGAMAEDQKQIEDVIFRYFSNKWVGRNCVIDNWPYSIASLNDEDREVLSKDFSFEELEEVIKKLGRNIALGKDVECFTGFKISLLINGSYSKWIEAKSGFRQGCPLSPFLFVMCAQLLTNVFSSRGSSIGVEVSNNGPKISHLLYADDIIIFSNAQIKSIKVIKGILVDFCGWTGQKLNVKKSGVLFGLSVKNRRRKKICRIMNLREIKEFCYLGVKVVLRRLHKADFQFLLDKTMSMLRVWGGKLFSLAGRITLVKSVLLTYPTFHSANSMVPKKVLYEIDKICKEFIWRKRDGNAGLHYPIIRWTVGNGKNINAFEDVWVLDKSFINWPTFVNITKGSCIMVENFLNDGNWNTVKLKKFFGDDLIDLIFSIEIRNGEDKVELMHKLSGKSITALAVETTVSEKIVEKT
ncbi:uncharacterized protein LOC110113604 [Dendrobium catenatum]|uniref:uncharacterized protein LOC110113604 n=1 Tax=Dendrobium catenatum TaxID=906689 RepID=UPI0009F69E44|nr:uncharacterized protein LOC110113604 [Dendrobium catenatum]